MTFNAWLQEQHLYGDEDAVPVARRAYTAGYEAGIEAAYRVVEDQGGYTIDEALAAIRKLK